MSECSFTEKRGKVISKAPVLFPRKILLAFAVLSAETPGLCGGDKAPVPSLPVPSPPLGCPQQAVERSPCVLQPLQGTRALKRTARCALLSAGPTPAYTWEPQPRPSQAAAWGCLTGGKRIGEGRMPRSPAATSVRHSGL